MKIDYLLKKVEDIPAYICNECPEQEDCEDAGIYVLFTDSKDLAEYPEHYPPVKKGYFDGKFYTFDVSYLNIKDKTEVLYRLFLKFKELPKVTLLNCCWYRGSAYKEVYEHGVCTEILYFGKLKDYGVKEAVYDELRH